MSELAPVLVGRVPVAPLSSMDEAVAKVICPDGAVRPGSAIAVNAEKVVRSYSDDELLRAMLEASLCYADGISVVRTLRRKGNTSAVRVPGVELWENLMVAAARHSVPVFILGATPEVNQAVAERLSQELGLLPAGRADGYFEDWDEMIDQVRKSGAKIVTVAMGSPRQERFIKRCLESYPDAFYMGVGGSYDVFTGRVRRAPAWMRRMGLEWLFRLIRQPTRIRRQTVLVRYLWWELTRKV